MPFPAQNYLAANASNTKTEKACSKSEDILMLKYGAHKRKPNIKAIVVEDFNLITKLFIPLSGCKILYTYHLTFFFTSFYDIVAPNGAREYDGYHS